MVKVYLKHPSQLPQGEMMQTGKYGGHYYESNKPKEQTQEVPKEQEVKPIDVKESISKQIKLISYTNPNLEKYFKQLHTVYVAFPLKRDELIDIIVKDNINIEGITINSLDIDIREGFAFTNPLEQGNIYLGLNNTDNINKWLNDELKPQLLKMGYGTTLNDITATDKRAATITHEIGHNHVYKLIGDISNMRTMSELRQKQFTIFKEYVEYIKKNYNQSDNDIYAILDEILAEDYRQLVGGRQARIPNGYLMMPDSPTSEQHVFKEGRLNILRKMGL